MPSKERLDVALVQRGLAPSREKAQAMILAGLVFLGNQRADKASLPVAAEDAIELRGAAHPYVSRGGLKLQKAFEAFEIGVRDAVAVDIGASTGGFTDVLLRNGAQLVYAVDVGYGQLDWKLRNDPRVVVMERTNARLLTAEAFPQPPTFCAMDVSFISIRLLLPVIAPILGGAGRIVSLVKPQFEVGRGRVGKKGVVREPDVHLDVLGEIAGYVNTIGWRVEGAAFSPVTGPEGNIEFLFDIHPQRPGKAGVSIEELRHIVENAHETLR